MKTLLLSLLIVSATSSFAQTPTVPSAPVSGTSTTPSSNPSEGITTPANPAPDPSVKTPADTTPGNFTAPAGSTPTTIAAPRGVRPQATPTTSATEPIARGNGKVSGTLIDSTASKPVEFATIALLNIDTNKPIDGTTADAKGKFTLGKLAPGKYRLQYSFIGYRDKRSSVITVERGSDINLGTIKLGADVRTLNEVNVVGQAAMIEEKVDRLVYNAD